jgi:hypothetical protein
LVLQSTHSQEEDASPNSEGRGIEIQFLIHLQDGETDVSARLRVCRHSITEQEEFGMKMTRVGVGTHGLQAAGAGLVYSIMDVGWRLHRLHKPRAHRPRFAGP